ncbi:hemin receptor [Paraflavitalea soli]|uniref:Hemin receptor n=1 Tax=Paraflavitalea soli TaxID=2315862 RepID=A0A3B7MJM6_9BACT|nr:globin domain-containing protein [Paraflavitalea soli]AXY74654.1 hemin receptor [Paraflavitalea soli]
MNTSNFELVRKSWISISKIDYEVVCGTFYIRLFQIAPELKGMFKNTSMTEQSIKLGCMLSYIISKYESMDDVLLEVKALGERHQKYGVKDEHYKAVGEALLWTLKEGLGEYWNFELANAWKEFYETLAAKMKSVSLINSH